MKRWITFVSGARALALATLLGLTGLAWAHGDEDHGDTAMAVNGAGLPRVEAHSDLFELVGQLGEQALTLLIDRYDSNASVLGARVMVESGGIEAAASFHADHGDYAVSDERLLALLRQPGEHALVFTVTLGEGCEPLRLGLCRYPDRVPDHQTGCTRVVRRRGWRLAGFCKTQYASLQGWEHFRRCHTAAVDLLASLRRLGLRVEINDEGGYWPGRNETELRRNVEQMNGIVAAFAGALKDTADETGGPPVQSPIFAHPHFERIEAEGAAQHAGTLNEAVDLIRHLRRPAAK